MKNFNPRPPCGGRLVGSEDSQRSELISIHVPRAGDDTRRPRLQGENGHFNPRPPCGGRHKCVAIAKNNGFISIHVPRAGDDSSPSSA